MMTRQGSKAKYVTFVLYSSAINYLPIFVKISVRPRLCICYSCFLLDFADKEMIPLRW